MTGSPVPGDGESSVFRAIGPYRYHGYLVESYAGAHASVLEILTELHPLDSPAGAAACVARLPAAPARRRARRAMYSERLGREAGLTGDPAGELGRPQSELWRAARLVVDTGLHEKRWSRDEAISYFGSVTGLPEGQVESEVDRYAPQPGQACAYMVGLLEFVRLRDEARRALGPRFRYPEFHAALLEDGPMPLPLLRRKMTDWIAGQAGGSAATAPAS